MMSRFGKVAIVAAIIGFCAVGASAENWGPFTAYECKAIGARIYGSVLWNIPWGKDYEKECYARPAPPNTVLNGQAVNRPPDHCQKQADSHEWGQWYIADNTCPHWGSFDSDGCTNDSQGKTALHVFAAVEDIPSGVNPDAACHNMMADKIDGFPAGRHPDKCDAHDGHEWGEYFLEDQTAEDECFAEALKTLAGG